MDIDTNEVVGDPSLEFDGQADSTDLIIGKGTRELEMDVVSAAERLFVINEGNTLSPRFHKLLYNSRPIRRSAARTPPMPRSVDPRR